MTVTLTMDPALSRVRIKATGLAAADLATVERSTDLVRWTTVRGGAEAPITSVSSVIDSYGRTVANGWGSTDTGQAWTTTGGAASDYSVSGGSGKHSLGSVNVFRESIITAVNLRDVDTTVKLTSSATAATQTINARLAVRYVDANNMWRIKVEFDTGGLIDLGLAKVVAGVSTFVASANNVVAYTPGSVINLRFRVVGDNYKVKVWVGAVEPAPWSIDYTETVAAITSGGIALQSDLTTGNTNSLPVTITFDDLAVSELGVSLDDYEFTPGVVNTYRVRGIETGAITYVGAGAAATAVNASVTPALPTGLAEGDAMVALASIRNSGTGTPNLPAGWAVIRAFGNATLIGKRYAPGDAAPTITFAGGVALADTIGQVAAWRRASIVPVTGNDQLNGSAQNIAYPLLNIPIDGCVAIAAGWKQDDWTSVNTLGGFTAEVGEGTSTAGDDAGQVWDYLIETAAVNLVASSFVVNGGAAAISRGAVVALPHADYLNEQTSTITPTLDQIWIKSVPRPFLNRAVTVVDWSDPARPARSSDNDAVGRSLPIAVTDVRGSKRFTLFVYAPTHEDAQTFDYIIASGDVLFIHTPPGCEVPGGFVRVDTTSERRPRPRASSRVFALPVVQCAAPGPDVVGAVGTWASVLAAYPTWAAVLAAFPTWADLLEFHGSPAEVIVP